MTRFRNCRRLAGWIALIVGPWTTVAGEPIGRGLLISSEIITTGEWGAQRYVVTHEYDLQGNLLKTVSEYDAYNDGTIDSVETVTNTYDSRGHLLTSTSGTSVTSYTYDAMGRETGVRYESDFDGDGVIDGYSYSRTYDASGNIVSGVYLYFGTYGNASLKSTSTFGPNGQELSRIDESDWEDDGVIDERSTTISTYDSQGHALLRESVLDNFIFDDGDYTSTETMTYDAQGNLLSDVLAQDYAATGDYWQSSSFTYDTHGRVLTTTTEHDYGADGVLEYRSVDTQTYNPAGTALTSTFEEDYGVDGIPDALYETVRTFDPSGHLTSEVFRFESGGFTFRSLRTLTYDRTGNLTVEVEESFDGNGVLQSRTTETNTY